MATLEQALKVKNELRQKFSTQEPWKSSFEGDALGGPPQDKHVIIFVTGKVPQGTYPSEYDGVQILIKGDPESVFQ